MIQPFYIENHYSVPPRDMAKPMTLQTNYQRLQDNLVSFLIEKH